MKVTSSRLASFVLSSLIATMAMAGGKSSSKTTTTTTTSTTVRKTTTTTTTVKKTTTTTTCPPKYTTTTVPRTTTTTQPKNPPPSEVTVFGPQKIEVGLGGSVSYSRSFNGIGSTPQMGHVLLTLGGDDLKCGSHPSILCILAQAVELLFRPDSVEVALNGKTVLKQQGYPITQKYDSVSVIVNPTDQLVVKLKGFPFSFATVEVKSQGSVQHTNPIASFSMTPTSGIAPQLVTFDALMSTASGSVISSYAWDFGDGATSTGSIVVHNYNSAGNYTVKLTVTDSLGGVGTTSHNISMTADQPPVPRFAVTAHPENTLDLHFDASASSDPDGSIANYSWDFGDGQTGSGAILDHTYSAGGAYTIQLTVTDDKGMTASAGQSFTVVQIFPPVAKLTLKSPSSGVAPLMVLLDGSQSTDPQGLTLSYTWDFGDGSTSHDAGLATHLYQNAGSYLIKMTVSNPYGMSDSKTVSVQASALVLPADPKTVAPPLVQNNVKVPFADSISFLYSGSNPAQTNVNTAVIDPTRVSVLRGQVVDDSDQPISGVKVTVNQGIDFGQTLTGADGFFNMAVNGGGPTTVQYEKSGYLPAQRTVKVSYNDFATEEKTILVATDAKVTKIQNESDQTQIAKGSVSSDNDGQRTAVLVIPASTTASIELPNGGTMVLPSLSLRLTEYTVGANGPKRMPASLPTTTSYTYAVDITSDEALALGAKHINFSQPVSFYVDNFLGFPVGMVVPVGSYDYDKGAWQASENGRVIKVLSINNGRAVLDISGNGQASASDLASLNITDDELIRIASSYTAGSTFWRARAARFSPMDLNVLAGDDGIPPIMVADTGAPDEPAGQCPMTGSKIDVLSQNLGEEMPVIGTDLKLMYNSKNSKNTTNSTVIKITGNKIPATLQQIDLTIEVAGRVFQQTFAPATNLSYTFVWDGLDAYGRSVDGKIKGHVTIGYRYPQDYLTPSLAFPNEFTSFGINLQDTNVVGRDFSLLSGSYDLYFGKAAWPESSIGQWTISNYHHFDSQSGILYYGDGSSLGGVSPVFKAGRPIEVVMGDGTLGTNPDGDYAINSRLTNPYALRLGKDRSIYFSENYQVIRRIKPDGTLQTIAGIMGKSGYTGDGGPATQATLSLGEGFSIVEGEGTEYYIADVGNAVVRKVDKNGIISTFAGNGTPGFSGDGGPATQAQLGRLGFSLYYYQGSLFIADAANNRIREVTPDGIIRTIVGTGASGHSPDGTSAASANISLFYDNLKRVVGMAFTKDGEFLFVDQSIIRKVNRLGQLETVAGSRNPVGTQDGILANTAGIGPADIKAMDDGSIYWADDYSQIRYMGPDGILQTLAGTLVAGTAAEGTFAKDTPIYSLEQFDISPDGDVYFVEEGSYRILKIPGNLNPKVQLGYYRVPSADGSEIYYFDQGGVHRKTTFGATDTLKYEFVHDTNNKLIAIKDSWGNSTTISRDSAGNVNSMTSPYGQVTNFSYDAQSRLTQMTLPNGDSYGMTYNDVNLLSFFRKPNGATSFFGYDTRGNLTYDGNAGGGFTSLSDFLSTTTAKTIVSTTAQGISETRTATTPYSGYTFITQTLPTSEQVSSSVASNYVSTSSITGVYQTSSWANDQRLGAPAQNTDSASSAQGSSLRYEQYFRYYDRLNDISDYKWHEDRYVNSNMRATTTFDSSTRTMTKTSTASGRSSTTQFNDKMQPTSVQVGALAPTNFQYDSRGNLISTSQGDRTSVISYGANGMPEYVQDGLGNKTSFEYDQNLRKTKTIYPNGSEVSYQYDANNNLVSITPAGRSPHIMNFNLVDLMTAYLPPQLGGQSTTTSYQYDLDKRMTLIQRPDGQQIKMQYDSTSGLLSQVQTSSGNYNFGYNFGRLSSATSPDGISTSIGYMGTIPTTESTSSSAFNFQISKTINALQQTSSITAGGIAINYGYDSDEMLVSAGSESLSYDSNSLLQSISVGNSVQSNSYNNFGEISAITVNVGSAPIFSQVLDRNKNGKITAASDGANTTNYTYDSLGRLIDVATNGSSVGHYTYDDNGNRISATVRGKAISATYDSQDRITSYGTKSYTFNAAGELASVTDSNDMTTSSYGFDSYGNLKQVTIGGKNVSYLTDASSRRIAKKVNGQLSQIFVYQSMYQLAALLDGNSNVIARFIYASKSNVPDYMIKNGSTYRFVVDAIGTVREIVDVNTGAVAEQISYDEFGQVLGDTNPGFQPFGFAGGLYDLDTKLVHFGARDYDPETGRWTSKDPSLFAGGTNLYGYSFNDPVNFIDQNGKNPLVAAIAIGAIVGASANVIGAILTHQTSGSQLLKAAITGAIGGATAVALSGATIVAGTTSAAGTALGLAIDFGLSLLNAPTALPDNALTAVPKGVNAITNPKNPCSN